MRRFPGRIAWSVFLRSFTIQGSWNYRTMMGTGMAFTLLPVLRWVSRDRMELERALDRHAGRFNAHPYLAGLALGSLARLEADGAADDQVRRFRAAVGGPLGGLGDRVVWATWLPLVAATALVALELGFPIWWVGLGFLVAFNVGHLGLRLWAFRTGLTEGKSVAQRLKAARLARRAQRAQAPLLLLGGALAGLFLNGPAGMTGAGGLWNAGAVLALAIGMRLGTRAWRLAGVALVLLVGGVAATGLLR